VVGWWFFVLICHVCIVRGSKRAVCWQAATDSVGNTNRFFFKGSKPTSKFQASSWPFALSPHRHVLLAFCYRTELFGLALHACWLEIKELKMKLNNYSVLNYNQLINEVLVSIFVFIISHFLVFYWRFSWEELQVSYHWKGWNSNENLF